jgi:two-component system sensor histidine kinase KdpD
VVAAFTDAGTPERADDLDAVVRDGMLCCIRESRSLGPGMARWPELDAWYIPLGQQLPLKAAACIQNASAGDSSGREYAAALCTLIAQALLRLQLTGSVLAAQEESHRHHIQSTFLAAISHDLRTPLAAIIGAASSLQTQRDKLDAAGQERLLGSILTEATYLSSVTENTLQLVRLDSSSELSRDWESMEEVVGAVLARVRQRDVTRRIRSTVPPGLPLVKADPVLLTQLLENLLDNALKYSREGIELVVSQANQHMQVAVNDRGPGIPQHEASMIFQPYRRNDRSGQRGSGLGLAVCRAIAEVHGGRLTCSSREGGGSSFVLALPLEAKQPERGQA